MKTEKELRRMLKQLDETISHNLEVAKKMGIPVNEKEMAELFRIKAMVIERLREHEEC